jgi:hypothetical protein
MLKTILLLALLALLSAANATGLAFMSIEQHSAARKAAARPSFCQWNYPGTACRIG